jgi:hypothetical protein
LAMATQSSGMRASCATALEDKHEISERPISLSMAQRSCGNAARFVPSASVSTM